MTGWRAIHVGDDEECESLCTFLAEHSIIVYKTTDDPTIPELANLRRRVTVVQVPEEEWERAMALLPSWTMKQQAPVRDLTGRLGQAFWLSSIIPAIGAWLLYSSPTVTIERHGYLLIGCWVLAFVALARRLA